MLGNPSASTIYNGNWVGEYAIDSEVSTFHTLESDAGKNWWSAEFV